jgi:hypothetical protein
MHLTRKNVNLALLAPSRIESHNGHKYTFLKWLNEIQDPHSVAPECTDLEMKGTPERALNRQESIAFLGGCGNSAV